MLRVLTESPQRSTLQIVTEVITLNSGAVFH